MNSSVIFEGPTRALRELDRAFQFGSSVEQPGIISAAHTATWHMAGMIEQLHTLRAEQAEQLRGELDAAPERPVSGEETSG
jgi:hypothetical protein